MKRQLIFLTFSIELCLSANILGIFPFPGYSHFKMFGSLMRELAKRGHNVDVVSHFPLETPFNRYTDIDIRGSAPIVTNNVTIESLREFQGVNFAERLAKICGVRVCQNAFKSEKLQKLKRAEKKYDLVLTELFATDCMLGWAWHFNVPSVVLTSGVHLPWASDRFGLPDNPAYISNYFVGFGNPTNLYQRLLNTWTLIRAKLIYKFHSGGPSNLLARSFFGENMPDLDILAKNTSLQLVNTHFTIQNARPLVPNVVEVAGLHIKKPKPVNEHFNSVLTTDKRGIIYFTLGSVLVIESMPKNVLRAFIDAFSELPYKIVWKGNKEKFPKSLNISDNIHLESWMPQLDILCDSRVKLFITHGGMMGIQEAVYCGIPIIGIPLFADQTLNLDYANKMGYGLTLSYDNLSRDTILSAVRKILNQPKYRSNAKRISEEFKDRPVSPMDSAIYWIEYVIRHKGAPKLASYAKNLDWHQYYLVDVIFLSSAFPLSLIYLFTKLLIRRIKY